MRRPAKNCLNLSKRDAQVRENPYATNQVTNQTEEVDQMAKSIIAHTERIFQEQNKRITHKSGSPGLRLS